MKRFAPAVPGPLIAVVLGIAASSYLHVGEQGVKLLRAVPAGLPKPAVPAVGFDDQGPLTLGAVGLALISFSNAIATARSFAVKNRYEIDANQEFVALGVADIGAGLLQGFAVSGTASRTAVDDAMGGKSQVTGLAAAGLIVVALLFLTGPLALLPGEVRDELEGRGISFSLPEAKGPLRLMLDRTGVLERVGRDRVFSTVESAVASLRGAGG